MTAVSRKALTAALKTVAPALPKATGLPALHGVHIDTGTGAVTCNNLDLAITTTVPILDRDTDTGAVLLPAKVLTRIVGSMSGETVHLSDPDERGDVTVKCGRTKATLPTIPTGDWFAPGDIRGATFTLTPVDVDRIRRVLHAASVDKTRPGLCGIHLTGNLAQATDSFRLAQVELDADGLPGVIVPTEALRAALGDAESQLVMVTDGRRAALSNGDTTWTTTLIDYPGGSYPAFDQVTREASDINVTVNVADLLDALHRLAALGPIDIDPLSTPRLTSDGDTLTITRRMRDVGAITDQVDCASDKLTDQVALNLAYLVDLLEQVDADDVTLGFVDPLKPVLVAEDRFVGLLMPVRVG